MSGDIDNPVLRAHPRLIAGLVDSLRPGFACNVGGECERTDADHEDIEALSVVEQAAIACSILAKDAELADHGWEHITGRDIPDAFDDPACLIALDAVRSIARGPWRRLRSLRWAEAEARIRNGEVKP